MLLIDIDGEFTNATLEGAAIIAEMIPRLKESYFVRIALAPHPLGPDQAPLTLTRQDVSLLIAGWKEQVVAGAGAPSFDCQAARRKVELKVCRSPELSARDAFLARLYGDTIASSGEWAEQIQTAQQEWQKARDACGTQSEVSCLFDLYDQRAFELAAQRGKLRAEEARPGGYAPVADFATVPRNVLGSELGWRLAALRARSIGHAVVEAVNEEEFTFSADALGGGGHACSLSGAFTYEPQRGIYVHRSDGEEVAQLIVAGDMILFLGAQDYCGARAQWPRVMRLHGAAN